MTRPEFEDLQEKFNCSGMALKTFLSTEGVAYSTYHYWSRKIQDESRLLPMAPIELRHAEGNICDGSLSGVEIPGVTLSFPNGVRAHFGRGSERVLMDVLTRSLDHVLPQ